MIIEKLKKFKKEVGFYGCVLGLFTIAFLSACNVGGDYNNVDGAVPTAVAAPTAEVEQNTVLLTGVPESNDGGDEVVVTANPNEPTEVPNHGPEDPWKNNK